MNLEIKSVHHRNIVLIAHDIRSTHNVGSLLRTAECFGVSTVFLTGYTPYPSLVDDPRLPHMHQKLTAQIHKTALGAETLVAWRHEADLASAIRFLKTEGFAIIGLEQSAESVNISSWMPPDKIAILLGREVEGIEPTLLEQCDTVVEIPQYGQKESLNVVQAAAIALYQARIADMP